MGRERVHEQVLFTCSLFSKYDEALEWGKERLSQVLGEIALESLVMPFDQTDYYEDEMGDNLRLQLISFKNLQEPERLPEVKSTTNQLEAEYKRRWHSAEARPLNIDPGYLTPSKFVLATTKDASHRLYLGRGIFGEVTLYYAYGQWQEREWTYANYREDSYKYFLSCCRAYLLKHRASSPHE